MERIRIGLLTIVVSLAACAPAGPAPTGSGSTMSMHTHGTSSASGSAATYVPGEGMDLLRLQDALPSSVIEVQDGGTIRLDPTMVRRVIKGAEVLQYGYNGQIPGPTIRVRQGSTFTVQTTNRIDQPTTIHWHGVRVSNKNDGTPGVTQNPIMPGANFTYTVIVPDDGVFWYHPHVREDVQMDLGLYGNIIVIPKDDADPTEPPMAVILDDILLKDDGSLAPYGKDGENYSLMGRFGNTLLANGTVDPRIRAHTGTQRLYLTNAANARVFRVSVDGAQMRLIGGDIGFGLARNVEEVILGPAERAIVDVTFAAPGSYALLHRSDDSTAKVATFMVDDSVTEPETAVGESDFPDVEAARLREPDHKLRITSSMSHVHPKMDRDGIEWEDSLPEQNAASNHASMTWRLVDDDTGKANMDILWRFKRGAFAKIRVKNDTESMQHPIHFHGQRFLVIQSNRVEIDDKQWKDTYLLRSGETVDLLIDMSNPGTWMFHCHIAEHIQNGMMGSFVVE